MNKNNGIVLTILFGVAVVFVLSLVWGGRGEQDALREQMRVISRAILVYQSETKKMPDSVANLMNWDDRFNDAYVDPWEPDQLIDLDFDADDDVAVFRNEHVLARITRDLDVVIEARDR